MTGHKDNNDTKKSKADIRAEKRAAALRANLVRRKEQSKEQKAKESQDKDSQKD